MPKNTTQLNFYKMIHWYYRKWNIFSTEALAGFQYGVKSIECIVAFIENTCFSRRFDLETQDHHQYKVERKLNKLLNKLIAFKFRKK